MSRVAALNSRTAAVRVAKAYSNPDLTERELDVLKRIVEGEGNRAIANDLTISIDTVSNHVKNIHKKLGARNRTHAAILAVVLGLVELPDFEF